MSGGFSAGGLITGIDSGSLIRQLIQLERQPILRIQERIDALEKQKDAIGELRTTLLAFRNQIQDFQFGSVFGQFQGISSDDAFVTANISGPNPSAGSFSINVLNLASATIASSSAALGAAIDPNATLSSSGISTTIEAGQFTINGVVFNVDPAVDSLNGIIGTINGSAAGVTATYDAVTDTLLIANTTPGDTSIINFGGSGDTSNLTDVLGVDDATQFTNGAGSTEVVSARNLGAVNPGDMINTVAFAGGAVTAGNFLINGVSITVDPTVDGLADVIDRINASDAGVTASYDTSNDTIRVVSNTLGSRTVSFVSGTSNFLDVTNLTTALQTAGNDAQFTIDGGAVQTSNTNDVQNVIGDVTVNLVGVGTSTITISRDTDSVIEKVGEFIEAFNESITGINDIIGKEGVLRSDSSLRGIQGVLRSTIFQQVAGITGIFESLFDVGISTGESFDASAVMQLSLDEDKLREALLDDPTNVESLFINTGKTGIGDLLFEYLDSITQSTGFLNDRVRSNGSIDQQIRSANERIERIERRVAQKEIRLRAQFTRLELIVNSFQAQGASLAGLSGGFQSFF